MVLQRYRLIAREIRLNRRCVIRSRARVGRDGRARSGGGGGAGESQFKRTAEGASERADTASVLLYDCDCTYTVGRSVPGRDRRCSIVASFLNCAPNTFLRFFTHRPTTHTGRF